ncbi:toprim domain-containing protein [Candidatus Woesebacteria bacterium]|nr:toprim domain-containing protein [Candidatus Woesebacteria bacterium]
METLKDKLAVSMQSMRDTLGQSYVKPPIEKLEAFEEALKCSQKAQDYLQITRNLTPDTITHFRLGYDADKDAIVIPNFKRGELINIGYRYLNPDAKAKYTRERGAEIWLYNEEGINESKEKGAVLVVEGEFDLMSVWQAGIKSVVSVASGKNSYGVWLELLDNIPKVYLAFDNDKAGKSAAIDMADRVGTEKSFEVRYPEGIKDANDFFKDHDYQEYRNLIKNAKPFYKYKYQGVSDVISSLREKKDTFVKLATVPFIEFEDGYVVVVSGVTNVGKTSYVMNMANELIERDIATLVLPIERGIEDVGKRFLQMRYEKTKDGLRNIDDAEWDTIIPDVVDLPIYFSVPKIDEVDDTIRKAKRLFNTKFIIVDHLDLFVRKSDPKSYNIELANTIQNFKILAQELDVIFIVVHHIKKQEGVGLVPKKPSLNDLKGSGSVKDDPEAVIMLSEPEKGQIEVDILKNKGEMGSKIYGFTAATGRMDLETTFATQKEKMEWFDSLPNTPQK